MPHLNNNKTKIQTQSSADRTTTSLSLAHQRKSKQNSADISPYSKLTETTRPTLEGQEPKGGKNSTFLKERNQFNFPRRLGKRDLKHSKLKKIIMKNQRNTMQMKEQTRSRKVQINEEEIGKPPEKEFIIMIVKVIKNLENKMEKM